jgi:hypothetical protein
MRTVWWTLFPLHCHVWGGWPTSEPATGDDFETQLENLKIFSGFGAPSSFTEMPGEPTKFRSSKAISSTTLSPQRVFKGEGFSLEEIRDMCPRLAHKAQSQNLFDGMYGPRFAPLLGEEYEEFPETATNGSVRIRVGDRLGRSSTSMVLTIKDTEWNSKWVLKYVGDCGTWERETIHPLLRDAWFLWELEATNLVPKVLYASPPAPMTSEVSRKTDFELSLTDRERCMRFGDRTVRFMIMERIDKDLYKLVGNSRLSVKNSLLLTRLILQGIGKMHAQGIVHGDIHPGNIGLLSIATESDPSAARLVFIDFGNAFYAEENIGKPALIREPMSFVHCLFSHWNLDGFRFGYRDDVFKALMVGAFLMNGFGWTRFCMSLATNGAKMMEFKRDSFLFEYPGGSSLASLMGKSQTSDTVARIRAYLSEALFIARQPIHVDSVPDYAGIIAHLDAAYNLL